MIHQHFKLVDVLTAAENIILGLPRAAKLDMKKVTKEIRDLADKYGFEHGSRSAKSMNMSVSQKQTVEIVKVLYRGARHAHSGRTHRRADPSGDGQAVCRCCATCAIEGTPSSSLPISSTKCWRSHDRVAVLRKGECIGTVDTKDDDSAQN